MVKEKHISEQNTKKRTDIDQGMLVIGGVPADKLAAACGTPLFVYDEAELEKKMRSYRDHFRSELFETEVIYASKAFVCKALLHMLKRIGFGIDVVSGGELYLADQAEYPMERVYFHGNNKSEKELNGPDRGMQNYRRRRPYGMPEARGAVRQPEKEGKRDDPDQSRHCGPYP